MKTPSFSHSLLLVGSVLAGVMLVHSAAAADAIIARVGEQDVTTDSIKPYLQGLTDRERTALEQDPRLLNQTVRSLILQQVLLKEAQTAGWEKRPEVAERIDRLRQAVIAESYLQELTEAPADYPSEKEVAEFYEAKKAELNLPKRLRLAQIFIARPAEADQLQAAAAKARLEAVQADLKKSGAKFAEVAQARSDDKETGVRGGDIGWLAETSIQPEVRKAVAGLDKGAFSAPIEMPDGWYIVQVAEIDEARTAKLDEVQDQVKRALREQRVRQNREAYMAKLQQQNPVSLNELELGQLLPTAKKD